MRIAPDINNPFPRPKPGPGNNGGQGGGAHNGGGFMPGELGGLANDLQMGYGGSDERWKRYLRGVYDPPTSMTFNFGNGGGKGRGGSNPGGNSPNGSGQDHNNGGFDPSRPRSMAMPMPMGGGLLSAQMPSQQQNRGLLGDIDPAIIAYLSGSVRR